MDGQPKNALVSGVWIGLGLSLATVVPVLLAYSGSHQANHDLPEPHLITNDSALPQTSTALDTQNQSSNSLPIETANQTVNPYAPRLQLSGVQLDQLSGIPSVWVHEILNSKSVVSNLPVKLSADKLAGDPALWHEYLECNKIIAYPAQGGGVVLVGDRAGIATVVRYLPAMPTPPKAS